MFQFGVKMNLESINKIKTSAMWKRMTSHKSYLDHIVIEDGGFKSLYVFFSNRDRNVALLTEWFEQGKSMGVRESLDGFGVTEGYNDIIKFS
jgi:hypothetical protein